MHPFFSRHCTPKTSLNENTMPAKSPTIIVLEKMEPPFYGLVQIIVDKAHEEEYLKNFFKYMRLMGNFCKESPRGNAHTFPYPNGTVQC